MNTLQKGYKIYKFTSTVFSTVAVVSAVRDDRGLQLPAVRSIELIVCKCNFHRKSSNVCLFNFCWGIRCWVFEQKISFRFLQVMVKTLSLEFSIFPYSILLHYYYYALKLEEVNIAVW